jgi:hypothetical protein
LERAAHLTPSTVLVARAQTISEAPQAAIAGVASHTSSPVPSSGHASSCLSCMTSIHAPSLTFGAHEPSHLETIWAEPDEDREVTIRSQKASPFAELPAIQAAVGKSDVDDTDQSGSMGRGALEPVLAAVGRP